MAIDFQALADKAGQERYNEVESRYLREVHGDHRALELLRTNEEKFGPAPNVDENDPEAVERRVQELRKTILDAQRELTSLGAPGPGSGEDTESDDEEDDPGYDDWKAAELDAELARRNLPTTGNKAEKAERLYADDEARRA